MPLSDHALPDREPDQIAGQLVAFANRLREELEGVATLEVTHSPAKGWTLVPNSDLAVAVAWMDWDDYLQVEVLGGQGGRWELGRSDSDVAFVTGVVDAVVAGRVSETFGRRRSKVTVTFVDGSTTSETGYKLSGCLPQPFWRRRGKQVHYQPWVCPEFG